MSALDCIRAQARALLPGECFLRRDQQLRALFVTDFPRRHPDMAANVKAQLQNGGFSVTEDKGLWLLDLNTEKRLAFIQSLPAVSMPEASDDALPLLSLCRRLCSQGDVSPEDQPWDALRLVLLRLDAGETTRLYNELSTLCAVLKRKKAPLPAAAVSLLLTSDQGGN